MATPSLAHTRTYTPEERTRMLRVLEEAEDRFRHELMGEEERGLLRDRIIGLKTRLARTAS